MHCHWSHFYNGKRLNRSFNLEWYTGSHPLDGQTAAGCVHNSWNRKLMLQFWRQCTHYQGKATPPKRGLHYCLSYLKRLVLSLQFPPKLQVWAAEQKTQQCQWPGNYKQKEILDPLNHDVPINLKKMWWRGSDTLRGCSIKMLWNSERPRDITHLVDFSLPYSKPYNRVKKVDTPLMDSRRNQPRNTHHQGSQQPTALFFFFFPITGGLGGGGIERIAEYFHNTHNTEKLY